MDASKYPINVSQDAAYLIASKEQGFPVLDLSHVKADYSTIELHFLAAYAIDAGLSTWFQDLEAAAKKQSLQDIRGLLRNPRVAFLKSD